MWKGIAVVSVACFLFSTAPVSAQISNDESIAQSLVHDYGITLEEANRRLSLLQEANDIAKKMGADIGVRYGGLRVTNDTNFNVEFLVTGNPDKVLEAYIQRPEFTATRVSRSYQALRAKSYRLVEALKDEDVSFVVAVLPDENRVRVVSPPTEKARGALRRTNLVDDAVSVVEEDVRVISVATCRGAAGLTGQRQRYVTSYDLEFRVPTSTSHTLTNQIVYAGTPMTIATTYNPRNYAEGIFNICKQGRSTGYTCAPVTSNYATVTGTPGGSGSFILAEKANTSLVGPGDSGGPVFVSGGAVGITTLVGGRVGSCGSSSAYWTKLYFQPVANLSPLNLSVLTTP